MNYYFIMKYNIRTYFLIFLILFIFGCKCSEKNTIQSTLTSNDVSTDLSEDSKQKARDAELKNYLDKRKPHPDSIAKWNAQVMAEQQKYVAVPDDDTKFFSIDPETGEVLGCPLIKFIGFYDEKYYENAINRKDSLRNVLKALKPKLKPFIMEGKDEMWYGDPKNVELTGGSPEAVHDGRGPVNVLFTKDGERIIVPAGYPHGGSIDEIFFFDDNLNLLAHHKLDRTLYMPYVSLNAEETYVILSNGVSGDFYFFTRDGKLERKGVVKDVTGDGGTSFGYCNISKNGEYWSLENNLTWLFNKEGKLISKFPYTIYKINEKSKNVLCIEYKNIFEKKLNFKIFSIDDWKLIYQTNDFNPKNFNYEFK